MRAICLHGHYYQPPREDPWLGVAPREPSAAPDRDWNTRINRESYAPAAAARLLDGAGRLRDVLNLYEWCSFDAAPTLLSWLEPNAPAVWAAIRQGDERSRIRTGFGNAWAQPYVHAILPLASPRDVRTHVYWGRRDFEHRFGRSPEGMWLPEMAVDEGSLEALVDAGITLTLLAPHQAAAVRPLGAGDDAWTPITPETLDVRQVYRCVLSRGQAINVLFRDAGRSQDIAFGALLRDGVDLADALDDGLGPDDGGILSIAVDGETYGHHHRFAEMAVAYAIDVLRRRDDVLVTNPAAYAAAHPPTHEVAIASNTSWSCAHGIERWRADCGCRTGGEAGSSQAWRAPLRVAIDWLRDELAVVYETRGGEHLRDPWGARDRYVDCLLGPGRTESFVADEGRARLSPGDRVRARCALEMARHGLLMQTSCGWFFDDLAGIEPLLVLRHGARAIDLAARLGRPLEAGFLDRLAPARSNVWTAGTGADLYREQVRGTAASSARIGATSSLLRALGSTVDAPGFTVQLADALPAEGGRGDVVVTELSTGTKEHVSVVVRRGGDGAPESTAGGEVYTLADVAAAQREAALDPLDLSDQTAIELARALLVASADVTPAPPALLRRVAEAETAALRATMSNTDPQFDALLGRIRVLESHGVRILTEDLGTSLHDVLCAQANALPESAPMMERWLDVAAATGASIDITAIQVALVSWWRDASLVARADTRLPALFDRLHVAPAG